MDCSSVGGLPLPQDEEMKVATFILQPLFRHRKASVSVAPSIFAGIFHLLMQDLWFLPLFPKLAPNYLFNCEVIIQKICLQTV